MNNTKYYLAIKFQLIVKIYGSQEIGNIWEVTESIIIKLDRLG